jgi:hypothetical protein
MNCHLKRFVEGKIDGRIRVRRRRGTRRKKLLDEFNERRRYWNLKSKHWITSCGDLALETLRVFVRRTTECMKHSSKCLASLYVIKHY